MALAILMAASTGVALAQAAITKWYTEAKQYIKAVNIAQRILTLLRAGRPVDSKIEGFNITIDSYSINPNIPFNLHTVTISFKSWKGAHKKISLCGGTIENKM